MKFKHEKIYYSLIPAGIALLAALINWNIKIGLTVYILSWIATMIIWWRQYCWEGDYYEKRKTEEIQING